MIYVATDMFSMSLSWRTLKGRFVLLACKKTPSMMRSTRACTMTPWDRRKVAMKMHKILRYMITISQ